MPDRNPRRRSNWKTVCKACRHEFLDSENMQAVADHWKRHGTGEPEMELVWIGRGPAPKVTPTLLN